MTCRIAVVAGLFSIMLQAASGLAADGSGGNAAIKIGERFKLRSAILNEERPYWVYLPGSYQDKEFAPMRYPVLYLLDGDQHFQSASGVVQFMSESVSGNAHIPELIIVAIPNTHRTRDLTPTHSTKGYDAKDTQVLASSGGGPAFLKFLKDELIPHIERTYRTEPYRILVGHSLGGLFAIGDQVQTSPVFQAHIAIDPTAWWDDRLLLRSAKEKLRGSGAFKGSLYVALANDPPYKNFGDPRRWKKSCRELANFFRKNARPPFYFRFQYFESETHASVPLLALYQGLLFTFEGFKPTISAERDEDPKLMDETYAKLSARLGYKVKPPERFINSSAWTRLNYDRGNTNAIRWLEYNAALYPNSSNVYASLGEALSMRGEKEAAIKLLKRSVEIWPDNVEAMDWLEKLTGRSKD